MSTSTSPFHNIEDRVIRIFISSTFSDMQEERNLLVTKVFPRLARIAARRDVTIVPLDLRWGVTEEAARQGKVIETCLNEIIHSRPFFIGLIGNRYGSCLTMEESRKNKELLSQYDWLAQDMTDGLSVTEIEIQYGVLRYPEDIDAFFYLKEADESTSDNPEKLSKLKDTIRKNGRYPVGTYVSAEDLAAMVERQFLTVLDKYFPDKPLTPLEKERFNQQTFMRSRKIAYIPLPEAWQALDDFLHGDGQNLVVTGESGMGKSALIANWIDVRQNQIDRKIIYHFVGNGGMEGDYHAIQQRLCNEIRDLYALPQPDGNTAVSKKLEDELNELLMEVAGREPLLIVLDGINQLSEAENAKQLLWLPIPPANVKYIFSTLPDDRTMEVFKMRHYPVYTLAPLDMEMRHRLVTAYLKEFGKGLSQERVERIVRDPQSENTLVLRSLLDELIGFGSHERLDERISYYLAAQSIGDFFQRVLQRIEDDLGARTVRHILSLIAFSQYGLSETEIMEIVGLNAYDWSVFLGVFRNYFTVKSGMLTFSHRYMTEACLARYASEERDSRHEIISMFAGQDDGRAWDELAFQYCALSDTDNLYALLLRLEVFDFLNKKDEYQLGGYWRLLLQRDEKKYTPAAYLEQNADDNNTGYYYSILGNFFCNIVIDLSDAILFHRKSLSFNEKKFGLKHINTSASYHNIGKLYYTLGDYGKALEYSFKALDILEKVLGTNHPGTAESYDIIGLSYFRNGDYRKALEYLLKALDIHKKVYGDHPAFAVSCNNIGIVYQAAGDYGKALEYYFKALSINEKIHGPKHIDTAATYINVGMVYANQGDYGKALDYLFKGSDIQKEILGPDHLNNASAYNNIGKVYQASGDYEKTLEYLFMALNIQEKLLDPYHPGTAGSYNNIGMVYANQGDYGKALDYLFKGLDIHEKTLGPDHPNTAVSYDNIGFIYYSQKNYPKASEYFLKALSVRREKFGLNHPDAVKDYNLLLKISMVYHKVGDTYLLQKDSLKALEYYLKTIDICEKIQIPPHQDTALLYNNVGNIYFFQGNYPKALEYYFNALDIREKVFGTDNAKTVATYQNIGSAYYRQKDYQNALRYYHKVAEIREKTLGPGNSDTISAYNVIAAAYDAMGEHEKAIQYYSKVSGK